MSGREVALATSLDRSLGPRFSVAPDVVQALNDLAAEFFVANLQGSDGARYATDRGLSDATVGHWRLGYAPPGNGLLRHLGSIGWPETTIIAAGLARSGERGAFDAFRDRLVMPIPDADGKILGFGSRRLRDDDDAIPKYVNSPETGLFHKGQTLYGLPNLGDMATSGEVFVVEGNLDMLALWQAGTRNVVALCGTALSSEHLDLLSAAVQKVTLVLDGDDAGEQATTRALLLPGAGDLDLGAVPLVAPNGEKWDPDRLIRERPGAWQSLQADRLPRWEWLWRTTLAPFADHLSDVEARVEWKNRWATLVRDHARTRREGVILLGRMERRLSLPSGLLVDEYLV